MKNVVMPGSLAPLTQSGKIVSNNITTSCCEYSRFLVNCLRSFLSSCENVIMSHISQIAHIVTYNSDTYTTIGILQSVNFKVDDKEYFQMPPSLMPGLKQDFCQSRCSQSCCLTPRSHNLWREPGLMSDSSSGLEGNEQISWNIIRY